MTSKKLKKLAQVRGIDPLGLSKPDLIRSNQRQEGNFDCFASAMTGECDHRPCVRGAKTASRRDQGWCEQRGGDDTEWAAVPLPPGGTAGRLGPAAMPASR